MTQIDTLVKQISNIAKSGKYGNPKDSSFISKVSKNHMTNVSSPVKAQAFAKFYKTLNATKKAVVAPMPMKLTGANKVKESIKKLKGSKKVQKPKSSPVVNIKAILAAKKSYQKNKEGGFA